MKVSTSCWLVANYFQKLSPPAVPVASTTAAPGEYIIEVVLVLLPANEWLKKWFPCIWPDYWALVVCRKRRTIKERENTASIHLGHPVTTERDWVAANSHDYRIPSWWLPDTTIFLLHYLHYYPTPSWFQCPFSLIHVYHRIDKELVDLRLRSEGSGRWYFPDLCGWLLLKICSHWYLLNNHGWQSLMSSTSFGWS